MKASTSPTGKVTSNTPQKNKKRYYRKMFDEIIKKIEEEDNSTQESSIGSTQLPINDLHGGLFSHDPYDL